MIHKLYCLKDVKVGFKTPFECVNNAVAIRSLKNALQDKNEFSLNPTDFELWCVGEYDDQTGIIVSSLDHVINVVDLLDHEA